MIHLKSDKEIALMQEGGKKLKRVLSETVAHVRPGIRASKLDQYAEKLIQKEGGTASFKRVKGYRWATCICVNDCVVHGIPHHNLILEKNDVVTVDVGMYYKGFHTDTSWAVRVRSTNNEVRSTKSDRIDRFLKTGEIALEKAIQQVKLGNRIGHISQAIQQTIEPEGYRVVAELVGHGVGKKLHEDPEVPGLLRKPLGQTPELKIGMTLAIEAIYVMGTPDVYVDEADGWTIRTKDGTIASCFEKTIALTRGGLVVLT
ncbi:type I methionyl aminopeptidase [Candidatus Roizmanbacteria bacterium]|nr:type I methionyl aminopeptidase [Candidatus Roizmanbacteria bacterium]